MVIAKDIKIAEISFPKKYADKTNRNFQKCVEYVRSAGGDPLKLLPKKSKYQVSFTLDETTIELANTIRKCIIDEIPIKSMTFNETTLITNDRFILSDYFKKNLETVPINQEISTEDIKISLDVANTDPYKIINIYSHNLQFKSKNNILDTHEWVMPNIILIKLRPNKFIKIDDIQVIEGLGYEDAAKFASVSNTKYEILNTEPSLEIKFQTTGKKSIMTSPSKIRIGYTTYGNITPVLIMIKCCDILTARLHNIKEEMGKINISDQSYFSDKLKIEMKNNIVYFQIYNEFWSLSSLLAKYCYIEDPNIPFVTPSISHPSKNMCYIKIKHTEYLKIIASAIDHVMDDIEKIKDAFIKF